MKYFDTHSLPFKIFWIALVVLNFALGFSYGPPLFFVLNAFYGYLIYRNWKREPIKTNWFEVAKATLVVWVFFANVAFFQYKPPQMTLPMRLWQGSADRSVLEFVFRASFMGWLASLDVNGVFSLKNKQCDLLQYRLGFRKRRMGGAWYGYHAGWVHYKGVSGCALKSQERTSTYRVQPQQRC